MKVYSANYTGAMGDVSYIDVLNHLINPSKAFFVVVEIFLTGKEYDEAKNAFVDDILERETDHVTEDFYPFYGTKEDILKKSNLVSERNQSIENGYLAAALQINNVQAMGVRNIICSRTSILLLDYLKNQNLEMNRKLRTILRPNANDTFEFITDYEPAQYATFFLAIDSAIERILKGSDISEEDRKYLEEEVNPVVHRIYRHAVYEASPILFNLSCRKCVVIYSFDLESEDLKKCSETLKSFIDFFDIHKEDDRVSRFSSVCRSLYETIQNQLSDTLN